MFDINVDISELARVRHILELIGPEMLPETVKSVRKSAGIVKLQWQYIAGASLKHSTGAYNNSLFEEYDFEDTPLASRVVCTHEAAEWLEYGHMGSFDLKKMLFTSNKVKLSKQGKRYIVIPFRHGSPGSVTFRGAYEKAGTGKGESMSGMPEDVFAKAKQLSPSERLGSGKTAWGGRLPAGSTSQGYKGKIKPKHKTDPFAGMVRIPVKGGGSEYISFRVMSEDSPGWIHPGNKPLRIAERASKASEEAVHNLIMSAVERDVDRIEREMHGA